MQALLAEGNAFMKDGLLKRAAEKYKEAIALVSVKTRVGGEATLQRAIALDSLGYSDEAKQMYKQITNHPVPSVSKKARQMLEGFAAAQFLKADSISYAVSAKEWDPYFRRFTNKVRTCVACFRRVCVYTTCPPNTRVLKSPPAQFHTGEKVHGDRGGPGTSQARRAHL